MLGTKGKSRICKINAVSMKSLCIGTSLPMETWRANGCSTAQQRKQQLYGQEIGIFPEHSKEGIESDR